MNPKASIIGPIRLPFLILTPVCVLLGLATVVWSQDQVNVYHFILALIGAISAHISVNTLNEYFDFKSGLDFKTTRTAFSGGSGVLPTKPELVLPTLIIAITTLIITGLVGLFFLKLWGVALLPIGLTGLLLVAAYTPWITRQPLLCLIAPGLGFGPLMVIGTHFVLTGHYSWSAFVTSLVPFCLVNNLLLLNQFPDVEADQSVGRRNLPISIGRRNSSLVYGVFMLSAFLTIVISVYTGYLPYASLISLLTIIIVIPAIVGVYRHATDTSKLLPYMKINVAINILTPVRLSMGLFLG